MNNNTQHSERIYKAQDRRWYFLARDRKVFGPFDDQDEATRALDRHINACQIRHSYNSFGWPRSWNPMRFARRPAQERSLT